MSASSFHTGFPSALPYRSQTALTMAASARCTTPFSGPSHRSCESLDKPPPESAEVLGDLVERQPDDVVTKGLNRCRADVVPAPDGEREAMPLVVAIGLQDDVRRRVVRIGVHRIGAILRPRRGEAEVGGSREVILMIGGTAGARRSAFGGHSSKVGRDCQESSSRAPNAERRTPSALLPPPIERHGQDDDRAGDDLLHPVGQAALCAADLDDRHRGGAENGSGDGASPARQAAAADDHRGDDVELEADRRPSGRRPRAARTAARPPRRSTRRRSCRPRPWCGRRPRRTAGPSARSIRSRRGGGRSACTAG